MRAPGDGVGSISLELDPEPSPGLQEENLNEKQSYDSARLVLCYCGVTVVTVVLLTCG